MVAPGVGATTTSVTPPVGVTRPLLRSPWACLWSRSVQAPLDASPGGATACHRSLVKIYGLNYPVLKKNRYYLSLSCLVLQIDTKIKKPLKKKVLFVKNGAVVVCHVQVKTLFASRSSLFFPNLGGSLFALREKLLPWEKSLVCEFVTILTLRMEIPAQIKGVAAEA